MKKFIFLFSLFFFHLPLHAQWQVLNEGFGGNWKIDFVNDDLARIYRGSQILKTIDGGETWNSIHDNEGYSFRKMVFINDSVGWAFGHSDDDLDKYKILKSENGGFNWIIQKQSSYTFSDLFVVNDSVVYITEKTWSDEYWKSVIYKTEDGGISWKNILTRYNRELDSIYFLNANVGIITANYQSGDIYKYMILKTSDGGQNWDEIMISDFDAIYDAKLINDSAAFCLAVNEDKEYYLVKTSDMFKGWETKIQSDYGIDSYFVNDNLIFAVVRDSTGAKIIKSSDGGITWDKKQYVVGGDILFPSQNSGFIFHNELWFINLIYKTIDGGESWKLIHTSCPFLDVFFIDRNTGYACASYYISLGHGQGLEGGYIFHTSDGGKNWSLDNSTNSYLWSCIFIDDQTGLRLGNNIEKTVDGGENWYDAFSNNQDFNGFLFNGREITVLDDHRVWLAGDGSWSDSLQGAVILGNNDAGETWQPLWKYPSTEEYSYSLSSIHAINNAAWAVGSNGLIVKSFFPDSFEIIDAQTDLPLKDVFFSDERHGWITGGYRNSQDSQSAILTTKDAGNSWDQQSLANYFINDMFFSDSLEGWAVGYNSNENGVILHTEDGAETWQTQVEGLSAPLNALHFKDGYGWAVGDNGLILRTDNRVTWINQSTGNIYPDKIVLQQNYPNPFNPKTMISYQLAARANNYSPVHVELSIYNVLGQKVATLVKTKQHPGIYRTTWDASGFSSGVYIYRLETDTGFKQSRKLILLR